MSDLNRFLEAQEKDYEIALKEIKNGKKASCWMWYIFPQLKGLGSTSTANYYGIDNIEEAIEYLHNETLSNRLIEISKALLELDDDSDIKEIMGYPDYLKLRSSMTLFKKAEELSEVKFDNIFQKVLDKYYKGEEDARTLTILEKQNFEKTMNKNNKEENSNDNKEDIKENNEKDEKEEEQNNLKEINLRDRVIRNENDNENEDDNKDENEDENKIIKEENNNINEINNINNNINGQQDGKKLDFIESIATCVSFDLPVATVDTENKEENKNGKKNSDEKNEDDDDETDKCCKLEFSCIIS